MRIQPDLPIARRFIEAAGVPGRLVLAGITGSHHYGFPSSDSDLDIKAIHLAPTQALLGLSPPRDAFERLERFEEIECDLTSNEARQALQLLLRGNGNMLERILCPYQVVWNEEVEEVQELARGAICKRFQDHYSGFLRAMRRDLARASDPTVKDLLYAYRVGLTGIHLLRTGQLEADLSILAEPYGLPEVLPLIDRKRSTVERISLQPDDLAAHADKLEQLAETLDRAREESALPEEPSNFAACDQWLVEARRRELSRSDADRLR